MHILLFSYFLANYFIFNSLEYRRKEKMIYNTWEKDLTPKVCPCCRNTAIAHCWLYKEPPPTRPLEDKRKAVGEAFMHADSEDCVRPQRLAALLEKVNRAGS
jgi:hypothetical protein